jgi:outer membrane protein with beta-barrel domain
MRLVLAGLVLAAAPAAADPVEIGASLGTTQTANDADIGADSLHSVGLYGRLHLLGPIAVQGELGRIQTDDHTSVRTASLAGVLELGHHAFVPYLLAGAGVDQVGQSMDSGETYAHVELGLGVQYRVNGGLTIGLDVREGTRKLESSPPPVYAMPAGGGDLGAPPIDPVYQNPVSSVSSGEYRSARVTVGIRF